MGSWKKYIRSLLVVVVIISLSLGFVSCIKDVPLSPSGMKEVPSSDSIAKQTSLESNVQILEWGDGNPAIAFTVSKWISRPLGGILNLNTTNGGSRINVNFLVLPLSINESRKITLTVDERFLDFEFEPSGTTFSPNAILNIMVEGLDLSGIDPNLVDFFYYNPVTGRWESVQSQLVDVNILLGTIEIKAALIPHFSRYAVAISR